MAVLSHHRSARSGHLFVQVCPRLSPWAFFLVYINNLVENVSLDARLFADDTSLFTVVYDKEVAATQLNSDLEWKMQFNPDKNMQAIQVIFSEEG